MHIRGVCGFAFRYAKTFTFEILGANGRRAKHLLAVRRDKKNMFFLVRFSFYL